MDRVLARLPAAAITLAWYVASSASGQMISVNHPFFSSSNGFVEEVGFGFGIFPQSSFAPNGTVVFRGPGLTPPLGGNSLSANLGFGVLGQNVDLFFNLSGYQASSRQLVSQTVTLAVPNGGAGQLIDASFRPFVVGIVPVVGTQPIHCPVAVSPVALALQRMSYTGSAPGFGISEGGISLQREAGGDTRIDSSSPPGGVSTAERGDISIAEIRRLKAAESRQNQQHAVMLADKARAASHKGKTGAARVLYRMAIKDAQGRLESDLQRELDALEDKRE